MQMSVELPSFIAGLKAYSANEPATILPNDALFLKQGEHLLKKGIYSAALNYLTQSLTINPECKV